MKKILIVIAVLLLNSSVGFSQDDLKPGFALLEKGSFAEGAAFFKHFLKTKDSANRTALLCYGRGIGLSGDIPEAQRVFDNLLVHYPGDFEISLNAAESFMWSKDYKSAKAYYEKLLLEKPKDFAANLGYANALASLFEYEKALAFTNKSVEIAPTSDNARISRKFARLGLADQYSKNQQYRKAEPLLEDILNEFKDDKDALFAKAQLQIMLLDYKKAQQIYLHLLELTKGQTEVFLNLSYLSFLQKDKALALAYADKAIVSTKTQPEKYLKARLGRVTALGWNERFKQAFGELEELNKKYPKNTDVLIKKAGLSTWDKEYAQSVQLFKEALAKVPSSFDGNLGCADALFAQELDIESKEYVMKTLVYYPNQKDANDFLKRLQLRHAPSITTHNFISSDQGGNSSINYQIGLAFDLLNSFRLNVGYKSRKATNSVEKNTAQTDNYAIGFRWRVKPFWLMTNSLSNSVLKGSKSTQNHVLIDFANEFKLTKIQTLELRYQTDIQNFTAGLIESNLTFQNYIATYSLNTPFKVGVYSQLYHTENSDGNSRNLFFASLYYDLKAAPVIKAGVNYNTMSFKKQVPQTYFSPSQFSGYEAFGLIENLQVPNQKLLYQLSVAAGFQRIEKEGSQSTYRVSGALGYRLMNNLDGWFYGMRSNSATSSVVGYTYTEMGFKAKYIIMK